MMASRTAARLPTGPSAQAAIGALPAMPMRGQRQKKCRLRAMQVLKLLTIKFAY